MDCFFKCLNVDFLSPKPKSPAPKTDSTYIASTNISTATFNKSSERSKRFLESDENLKLRFGYNEHTIKFLRQNA